MRDPAQGMTRGRRQAQMRWSSPTVTGCATTLLP